MAALTQTIDILPTLFELYGVSYDSESVQGKSLLPLIAGDVDAVNQCIFARSGGRRPSYMVRDLHWSLLLYQSRRMRALYDLDSDPGQTSDVYAAKAYRRVQLLGAFQTFIKTQVRQPHDFINPTLRPGPLPEAPVIEMSEETQRSLRALGYLR
jgi:arylsulfatase A-like enzyme